MVEIIDNRRARDNQAQDSGLKQLPASSVFGVSTVDAHILSKDLFEIYHEMPDTESFLKAAILYAKEQDSPGWAEFSLFLAGRMSEMNEICWASHSKESLVHFIIMLRAIMGGA